ncbi:MAG TPA: NAD(P)H-dependent glycerol-3-phosphate dehydrogenase [Candidatus Hydrogenedentes bacterium]|nr:NAD(P)H-dependent glycerol-3-phosphate dehydrogenase [Candidatus Hydrogenedentota bacterium]
MYVQVMGSGSWGLALARRLAMNGHHVRLWAREQDGPDMLRDERRSPYFLPGILLPREIEVSREADPEVEAVVLAVPSHGMRAVLEAHPFSPATIRINAAKGIENTTLLRMDEVIHEVSGPCPVVTLSGPSHAEEVARDLPASLVAAGVDLGVCQTVQQVFMADAFRVYTSTDIAGVGLGGALKNVIAIAAGVCDGFQLGDNAKAALITRGLAEITRLGVAMGADPLTFAGLSGMGDLIVTCESRHSRNRGLGERIARGEAPEDFEKTSHMVAEGVRTTQSAVALARKYGVDMPICGQVHRVLFEGGDPRQSIAALMQREPKPELRG